MTKKTLCLHQVFEQVAQQFPQKIALRSEQKTLTYGQLNRAAEHVASQVQPYVDTSGQLIGICLPRSIDWAIAMLGVLKAGGAFLPIDPDLSASRRAFIVSDSGIKMVITLNDQIGEIDQTFSQLYFNELLDANFPVTYQPLVEVTADDLAYVIYTSGSTGEPKGSMIEHRNVTRLFSGSDVLFEFNSDDVWSIFHSFSFDFSVWELWGALLHGATGYLVSDKARTEPKELVTELDNAGVSILSMTPSSFSQFAKSALRDNLNSLRYVIFGGERLQYAHLEAWLTSSHKSRLVNMYGITETTVHVTFAELVADELTKDKPITIGRPLPDLEVFLLDDNQQPVEEGQTGEIAVAGAGLSRGYLNRPDLTNERFVILPLGKDGEGKRVYLSGDHGRTLGQQFFYEGRKDDQVKLRGFRVELGEIESVISKLESVQTVAVVKEELDESDARLVAFVQFIDGDLPQPERVKSECETHLPPYAVPSLIHVVNSLPLTHNGKVNKQALMRALTNTDNPHSDNAVQQTSEQILALCASLLSQPSLCPDTDLFDQGATSLSIVRVLMEINNRFKTNINGADVAMDCSVNNISRIIEKQGMNKETA